MSSSERLFRRYMLRRQTFACYASACCTWVHPARYETAHHHNTINLFTVILTEDFWNVICTYTIRHWQIRPKILGYFKNWCRPFKNITAYLFIKEASSPSTQRWNLEGIHVTLKLLTNLISHHTCQFYGACHPLHSFCTLLGTVSGIDMSTIFKLEQIHSLAPAIYKLLNAFDSRMLTGESQWSALQRWVEARKSLFVKFEDRFCTHSTSWARRLKRSVDYSLASIFQKSKKEVGCLIFSRWLAFWVCSKLGISRE